MISILSVNADADADAQCEHGLALDMFGEQPEVHLRYQWGERISFLCFIFSFITCHSIRTFER